MTGAALTIVAESVRKAFPAPGGGTVPAVDNVSLSVRTGALTALVGPDGAGKTTLIRLVAGLMAPDAGRLRVLDIDVVKRPQAVQDRISYMPQRFGLYEDLSVQENLDLYADLHGVPQTVRTERFGRLLEMTDLAAFTARPAGKLSGGMKQKLGLACTLVRSPDLLLLDEPTVGVDPLSRRELWAIVQQLVEDEQLSVLISTAYMDEAERCAQVFVMHQGQRAVESLVQIRSLKFGFIQPGEILETADHLGNSISGGDGDPVILFEHLDELSKGLVASQFVQILAAFYQLQQPVDAACGNIGSAVDRADWIVDLMCDACYEAAQGGHLAL